MIHNGNDLILMVGGVAVAASKSCKVSIDAKTIDTASPGDGQWEHCITGRKSWSISADHIVQSLSRAAIQVGTTVDIQVTLRGSQAKGFAGFVDNVTITSGTYTGSLSLARGIFWDKTNRKFLLKVVLIGVGELYYAAWTVTDSTPYTSPSAYDTFKCDGVVYSWLDGDLMSEKLTGRAIVKSWDVQGTRGNIMMGSFSFKGTGPLTPASLPATT
ncbi:MAG: hypothetical protein IKA00_04170 [Prevotella sp.]|nr:hypothetical protein [Prevotella sp.]